MLNRIKSSLIIISLFVISSLSFAEIQLKGLTENELRYEKVGSLAFPGNFAPVQVLESIINDLSNDVKSFKVKISASMPPGLKRKGVIKEELTIIIPFKLDLTQNKNISYDDFLGKIEESSNLILKHNSNSTSTNSLNDPLNIPNCKMFAVGTTIKTIKAYCTHSLTTEYSCTALNTESDWYITKQKAMAIPLSSSCGKNE